MHYFFPITVLKNTLQSAPYYERLRLTYGVITSFFLYIPRGHVGLTGLQILYHERQLYPLNTGGYYTGNETTIPFIEYQPITVNPYELKARAWNTDDTYDHTFYLGLSVLRPEEMERSIPEVSQQALYDLIGSTVTEG